MSLNNIGDTGAEEVRKNVSNQGSELPKPIVEAMGRVDIGKILERLGLRDEIVIRTKPEEEIIVNRVMYDYDQGAYVDPETGDKFDRAGNSIPRDNPFEKPNGDLKELDFDD